MIQRLKQRLRRRAIVTFDDWVWDQDHAYSQGRKPRTLWQCWRGAGR